MRSKQKGFSAVELVIVVLVVGALAAAGWFVLGRSHKNSTANNPSSSQTATSAGPKLKSIGFNLGYYDPTTKRAGDFLFTDPGQNHTKLWEDFGQQDPRSPNDPTKTNPQPTFILPLGTKVLALVDGTVANVEKLYSDDYTIMVQAEGSDLIFETEHVNNPVVKKGDRVKGGQVIAEVSTHDSQYHPGLGILEIGILQGGNPPQHLCPFSYLDDSIKQATLDKISALYKAWEEYTGKDLYNQESFAMPGCVTLDPSKG